MEKVSIPMYIGIFTNDNKSVHTDIYDTCEYLLDMINSRYKDDSVSTDISNISKKERKVWSVISDPHITTLFLGKKIPKEIDQKKIFDSFICDTKCDVCVYGVVYVTGGLIVGVTCEDRSVHMIDNRFDHITLMVSSLTAKYSNNVLEYIFDNNKVLKAARDNKFIDISHKDIYDMDITIKKAKYKAYFVKLEQPIVWKCSTKKIY